MASSDTAAPGQHDAKHPAGLSSGPGDTQQAVRFASVNQEIEPEHSLQPFDTAESSERPNTQVLSPETQAELQRLSTTLQNVHLQQRRLSNFAFEPVSLPVSRVPSNDPKSQQTSRENTISAGPSSFRRSPAAPTMHSPPLTPAATRSRDEKRESAIAGAALTKVHPEVSMTPQISPPRLTPPLPNSSGRVVVDGNDTHSAATSRPPSSSGQISTRTRPTSTSEESGTVDTHPRHESRFLVGPSGGSFPASREQSPSRTSGGGSGTVTPPSYSRPFTPLGEHDNPYARSKRPPQPKTLEQIESRFVFGGMDGRRRSGIGSVASSVTQLPRSRSGGDLKGQENKHQSTFSLHSLGGKKDHFGHLHEDSSSNLSGKSHGSMSELKRFFRIGNKSKRAQSPSASSKASVNKSGTRTPPHQMVTAHVPFGDDHGIQTKYGKFGKILGSGAGGSVRLMKRSSDGVTFAVKQFRDRHSYETEKEYAKKVTAEFCIGSTLHHGNIIETLDIVYERGHWYEVMEYAPYDLFAIVMTGKMTREEIACSFLQILSGVTYLHSMGLAHRDLKLDNVVVNEHGIMKLIDFGSACIFRYPFENDIVLASGVVGSDPYLAPEVYDNAKYDPQPVDIWSLAIIFACMSLRRFPWKAPRLTDNSYKLFVSAPTPGTPASESGPRRSSEGRPKSVTDLSSAAEESRRRSAPHSEIEHRNHSDETSPKNHHHQDVQPPPSPGPRVDGPTQKQEVIKGPWRLLRLLPRESRNIIGAMLEIDSKRRATMDDLMQDPWITQTPVCRQEERGVIIKATNHEHTLEPGTAVSPAPSKR